MWCIQATVEGRQVPTFYLSEEIQGISGETMARRVAKDILLTSFHATRSSWSDVIDDSWEPDIAVSAVRIGDKP